MNEPNTSQRIVRQQRESEEKAKKFRLAQKLVETAIEQGVTVEEFVGALEYAEKIAMLGKLNLEYAD